MKLLFRKLFCSDIDIIDHSILLDELRSFNIDQTLFFWIRSFLTNRTQAVCVDGSSQSSWKQVDGGAPQGTKLGLTLFAVSKTSCIGIYVGSMSMTLLHLRLSHETITRLDVVVREIHDYCIGHKMKLNPKKCKEMYVNFMKNSITAMRPISVRNQEVELVRSYKLLAVIISDDLKWNAHVEHVIAKAAKRLYTLRLLKRAGFMPEDMLKVYTYNIRLVLEYAAQVWQDIPDATRQRAHLEVCRRHDHRPNDTARFD